MFYEMFLCFRKSTQRDEQFVANFKGFTAIFNLFKIVTKNIADMHREHDVSAFFEHRKKHRGRCFFQNIA